MKKFITYFLSNPLFIVIIGILIAYLFNNYVGPRIIVVLFILSLIIIGYQKRWFKLISSFLLYIFFFGGWLIVGAFFQIEKDLYQVEIGNESFYKKELKHSSNLDIPSELEIIAKLDTIRFIGFEGEYDAECIYKGTNKSISKLQISLDSNREFKKDKISIKEASDVLKKAKLLPRSFKYVYTKSIDGVCEIEIGFNEEKTKMWYSAFYY